MDLGQLQAFVVVAEELHFGKAAARLHISQPPLSRAIKMLEEEMGIVLFERTSRRVSITPAGKVFRERAREILAKLDSAVAEAVHATSKSSGNITIGFVGASTYAFLPRLAEALNERLPWLSVNFVEATSLIQLDQLALDRLDIGLMRPVEGTEAFERMTVMREPLMLAAPLSHKLARRSRIDIHSLNDERLISFSTESPYLRAILRDLFTTVGVRPNVFQEFAQSQAILSLVSAGLGVAVVPGGTSSASFDNVVFRPLRVDGRRHPELNVDLVAVWKKESRNPAREAVLDLLSTLMNVFPDTRR